MCHDALHPLLAALPKCEHHMHLEGALSPNLFLSLAARNNISLPTADPAFSSVSTLLNRYENFISLDDFLHYYYIAMSCLITSQDFEELAWDYFKRAHADGVVHAEISFDPQAHIERGVGLSDVIEGIGRARVRAEKELGISSVVVMCFLRHLPVAGAEECYELARSDLVGGALGGIGLDSSELGNPPGNWKGVFERAKKDGVRRTAHAGEEGPVEYIREALEQLDVGRIDHGIRLSEDESLMKEVAERKILVTVCPLSNVRLRCVKSVGELPIKRFLSAGIQFSINSDDPAYFGGYILDNYCAVQEAFDLTVGEWEGIAKAAIDGSWCRDDRKAEVRRLIDDAIKNHSKVELQR